MRNKSDVIQKAKKSVRTKTCRCKGKCTCVPKAKTRALKNSIRQSPDTVAVMKCDIGFGNTLFIRGEGSNLSWDRGVALTFDEKEQGWCFRTSEKRPVEFKVLINDRQWSEGENFTLSPGGKQIFEPGFLYG